MVDRLPQQYKSAPRMLALAKGFASQLQEFADAQWNFFQKRQLQRGPAAILGRAHFFNTSTATLTWNFPFADASYLTLAGKPVVLDSGGGVAVNLDGSSKTTAGIAVLASANFTGYVDVLAWDADDADPTNRGAGGDLLDKLGKIVGQPRNGMDDPSYFIFITARIKANNSDGRRETLIALAKLLVPGASIYVKDFPPCSVYIAPQAPIFVDPYVAGAFLVAAKSAGVNVAFVWTQVPAENTITLGDVYAPGFSAGPPVINTGVLSTQCPGDIYGSGFSAGPIVSNDGGGVFVEVVQSQG